MKPTRSWPVAAAFAAILVILPGAASTRAAAAPVHSHGLSAFGPLKYPADFQHFDYVNPSAPKGGSLAMTGIQAQNSFDSLNPFIVKGVPAEGIDLTFDTLMTRAIDEPDAVYGLVAQAVTYPPDKAWAEFALRPEARFSDGSPVTAADVVASFDLLKHHGAPVYRLMLRDVAKAEARGPHTVRYTFTGEVRRDLPLIVATLPILSKAYYAKHDFEKTTVEPPLGSGPYKVADVKLGRSITYRRRADYWAKDLPINRGRFNFDTIRYDFFRDRNAQMEAFKAGVYDLREEFTAKTWETEYDFPAVRDKRVVKAVLPDRTPSGVQGFFMNTRRAEFADRRVREALDLAFDFRWINKTLFYGQYTRTHSIFENSDLTPHGLPSAAEQALLDPFKAILPPSVFGPAYTPPDSGGTNDNRANLRKAVDLLRQAGWTIRNGTLVDAAGKPFQIEFLEFDPSIERVIGPYTHALARLGIKTSIRLVDMAQYQQRLVDFDFDVIIARFSLPNTPGLEQRSYWSSAAADAPGSFNYAGVRSKAIDTLVEDVVSAQSRAGLATACAALDRVIMAERYLIPQWYKPTHWIAYWDKFGRPAPKALYDRGIVDLWWVDPDKAARLAHRAS
jgi:microcin C transport system substrate-binding protein